MSGLLGCVHAIQDLDEYNSNGTLPAVMKLIVATLLISHEWTVHGRRTAIMVPKPQHNCWDLNLALFHLSWH